MGEAQVAILCGGAGRRLGPLTAATPKPLLQVGDRPFLDYVLFEIGRYGFRRIVLLAGYMGAAVSQFAARSIAARRFQLALEVSVEPEPLGSGGALKFAENLLADEFLLLNGDTWFDVNYHALLRRRRDSHADAAMALHRVASADRYNVVDFDGSRISRFGRNSSRCGQSYVNGGVIACSRSIVRRSPSPGSLEEDVWPGLAREGKLAGLKSDGYFLDIGLPAAFERAQTEIPRRCVRPAVLFDSSSLIGEPSSRLTDRISWAGDAIDAIRACNDHGCYVFVIQNVGTNNAASEDGMQAALACEGAHVDDWGARSEDSGNVSTRRASATCDVVFDMLNRWPVDKSRSIVIRPQGADGTAAAACGITEKRFVAGSLMDVIAPYLHSDCGRI